MLLAPLAGILGCTSPRDARRITELESRVDSFAVTLTQVVAVLSKQGGTGPVTPDSASIDVGNGVVMGSPTAPVTIVEFTDFQCPFCGRHASATLPELRKQYIATGKVRYILRDLPLGIHPYARPAAVAAWCVAQQGVPGFWALHDTLFASQANLSDSLIRGLARRYVADTAQFTKCLSSPQPGRSIDADIADAGKAGFSVTPTFVVGPTQPDGQVRGVVIAGAYPMSVFEAAIRGALPGAPVGPSH